MVARIIMFSAACVFAAGALAQEPKELAAARRAFEALKHPTERDRVSYVTQLVRLRETFTRAQADIMFAIDAEVRRHPMPKAVPQTEMMRKRIIGQWQSPRRPYFYHADGTWLSDEDTPGNTGGRWHVEGNTFFQNHRDIAPENGETIILLTGTDFVYGDAPYYLRRGTAFPWR